MVVTNELRETTRVVRVLHAILDQILSFDREHEKPSDQVTHLLTILYKALQSSQSLSGNNAEHKTLWDLFVNTMLPYVSMIEDWIYDGILNDEIEEFMIKEYVFLFTFAYITRDRSYTIETPEYWDNAYTLRPTLPFLDSIQYQLLMTGKSLILIQHLERGTTYDDDDLQVTKPSLANAFLQPDIEDLYEGSQYPIGSIRYTSPRKFRLEKSASSPSINSQISPTSSRISRLSARLNSKPLMKRDLSFSSSDPRQSDPLSNAQVSMFFNPPIPSPSPRTTPSLQASIPTPPPPRVPIERHIASRLVYHIQDQYERAGKFLVHLLMPKIVQDLLLCKSIYLGEAGDVMDMFCIRMFDEEKSDRAEWSNLLQEVLRIGMESKRKSFLGQ
jgi:hypothetical protein